RRELDVRLFGDRARLRDVRRDARDALDFVLGDDRAARESPDAAVDDAHAESGRAPARAAPAARAAAAAEPAEAAASAAEATEPAVAGAIGSAVRVDVAVDAAREADVGVRAADAPGFAQRDVRQPFERGRHRVAFRRLRNQLGDEVARGDDE